MAYKLIISKHADKLLDQLIFEAEFSKVSYQTNIENVFACGDCRTGQSLVVKAMVDGQKCVEAVAEYLDK